MTQDFKVGDLVRYIGHDINSLGILNHVPEESVYCTFKCMYGGIDWEVTRNGITKDIGVLSPVEAIWALQNGYKIKKDYWGEGTYFRLNDDGKFVDDSGVEKDFNIGRFILHEFYISNCVEDEVEDDTPPLRSDLKALREELKDLQRVVARYLAK